MERIARWGPVVLVVAAMGLLMAQAPQAEPEGADRFAGTWRYQGTPAEGRSIITRAIESATDDMFFVTRGVARGRLEDKNQFTREVEFGFPPGRIRIGFDMSSYETPASGRSVQVETPDGETARLSQRLVNGRLLQVFRTDEGTRTNAFMVSPDGSTLRYQVRVDSDQLPQPVRYRLFYRRVPAPANR